MIFSGLFPLSAESQNSHQGESHQHSQNQQGHIAVVAGLGSAAARGIRCIRSVRVAFLFFVVRVDDCHIAFGILCIENYLAALYRRFVFQTFGVFHRNAVFIDFGDIVFRGILFVKRHCDFHCCFTSSSSTSGTIY